MDPKMTELEKAARKVLLVLDHMSSERFALGDDRPAREALRAALQAIDKERASLFAQKLDCGHTMADWIESGMGACGACERGVMEFCSRCYGKLDLGNGVSGCSCEGDF